MKSGLFFSILIFSVIFLGSCQNTTEEAPATDAAQKDIVAAMDEYHRVLRPLMHQAFPEQNVTAFKENAAELLKCSQNLTKATIPEKLRTQEAEIKERVNALLQKTRAFKLSCETATDDEIFEAFRVAHDEFEELADIVYKI